MLMVLLHFSFVSSHAPPRSNSNAAKIWDKISSSKIRWLAVDRRVPSSLACTCIIRLWLHSILCLQSCVPIDLHVVYLEKTACDIKVTFWKTIIQTVNNLRSTINLEITMIRAFFNHIWKPSQYMYLVMCAHVQIVHPLFKIRECLIMIPISSFVNLCKGKGICVIHNTWK